MGKVSTYPLQTNPTTDDTVLGTRETLGVPSTVNYSVGDLLEIYRIPPLNAPAETSSDGDSGELAYDDDYAYVRTAASGWKRTPITAWPNGFEYTVSNLTGTRTFDPTTSTVDDLMEFVGQLVEDLKALKILE